MTLGRCLSSRLPDRISSPTMRRPKFMWRILGGGGGGGSDGAAARPCGSQRCGDASGAQALAALPAGSARTRAPRTRRPACRARPTTGQSGARTGQRAERPDQRRRGAEVPAAIPIHSIGQRCSRRRLSRSARCVFGEHVEAHHAIGEPAPDQRRDDQYERRNEPERHADRERDQRDSVQPSDRRRLPEARAVAALELGKRRAATRLHERRRHQHRTINSERRRTPARPARP